MVAPNDPSPSQEGKHLAFPTRESSSSSDTSPKHRIITADEVMSSVCLATRYAFADLITTVLRLDFWDNNDPGLIFFCKIAFEIAMKQNGMPERTQRTLKAQLEGEAPISDIATLIMHIKNDPVIEKEGTTYLLSSLLLSFVSSGNYDSRYRVLLRHLSTLLAVVWDDIVEIEASLASMILDDQFEETENMDGYRHAKRVREKSERKKKMKRYLMIGAASGVGGVLIGLTGGLAAPLVAAGAGILIGTGAAAGIGTVAGAAVIGTTFGVAGAGLTGYKMKKRVGAIEEFSIDRLSDGSSLNCVLVVSGWIDKNDMDLEAFTHPWRHLLYSKEQYTLRYESKYLAELGKAIEYLAGFAVSAAIQHTLMETALAGLMTAVAWPVAILSCASVLDNPWNVCISRAAEVGEHLAEVLLSRSHGKRPISLIGFSLGARVIYHCLLTLSKRQESAGIVEDVILLGAPVSASSKEWESICSIVAGRVINGYCETDWLLRFVYRTMSVQFAIAGTEAVEVKSKKIVNYNVSHIVKGHMDYSRKLTELLSAVGVRVSPHTAESSNSLMRLAEQGDDALDENNIYVNPRSSAGSDLQVDVVTSSLEEIRVRDDDFNKRSVVFQK